MLNATNIPPRKAEIVEKVVSTLAQRIAVYNEALRGSQANVVDLYWKQLREVADKVNGAGRSAKLVLFAANGQQVLPPVEMARAPAVPPPVQQPATRHPQTRPVVNIQIGPTDPRMFAATTTHEAAKRKREDDDGGPAPKRINTGLSNQLPPISNGFVRGSPISSFIAGTNVSIEELDDPFFKLAPYPPLANFCLDGSNSQNISTYASPSRISFLRALTLTGFSLETVREVGRFP